MSLKTRKAKINQVAHNPSTRLIFDNSTRKTYHVDSTRTGKPYQVQVEWSKNGILQAKCQLYTFDHKEQVNQRGNHRVDFNRQTVSYQALGALKAAAKDAGRILSICESYKDAKRLLNLGGELVKIVNLNRGTVWGVVK